MIAENVARIRAEMEDAAKERGSDAGKIKLVAAAKMNDAENVRLAIAAGVDAVGENRVQEMLDKDAQGAYAGAPLHFIGHLQKNKVKAVVGRAGLIESVDSAVLLRLIGERAVKLGITQDVLIELNVAGEASKTGLEPSDLESVLETAASEPGIRVRGLMAIPPISVKSGANRGHFSAMYKLFIDIGAKKYDNVFMDFLSMGMSGDFKDAIAEGANMVRVGSAIFGTRG